jgi:uncharacterized protein with von Willebrand factor type A (vWA) domain
MLIDFFYALRDAGLPVALGEFLTLLDALQKGVIPPSLDAFYYLARLTLVKDESRFDRFDKVFAAFFKDIEAVFDALQDPRAAIPADWLVQRLARDLTLEQKAQLRKLGYDKLMDRLQELLREQQERHAGGSKWIGTGGTSPFGHGGFNPEGMRIGGDGGGRSAVKVWDARTYRDYDGERELGTRNIKVALRRLRRFAREGAAEELALDETIRSTASNAGWLDIRMRPERRNRVRVLLLLDVGGSMDDHIERTEALFAAAKSEFRQLDFFYFHNCVYDHVWKSNGRRQTERFATWDLLRTYPPDTRLIFVGDATMSPYEIVAPGGSVETMNDEPGATWLARLCSTFPRHAWLNPEPEPVWAYRQSIAIVQRIVGERMFPVTIDGLERAMRTLAK